MMEFEPQKDLRSTADYLTKETEAHKGSKTHVHS